MKRAGAADGAFSVDGPEAAKATVSTAAATAVSGVDALLAMQDVNADGSARRRAVRRGHDMLDILDEIRIALLDGEVPEAKLKALLRVVSAEAAISPDPVVNAVVAEIDLRARVELAKFGHYS